MPNRDQLTALILLGIKTDKANQSEAVKAKAKVPPAIAKAAEQKGKVVVQKTQPPGRTTMAPAPKAVDMREAIRNAAKAGGSIEAVQAVLAAGRSPAPTKEAALAPV
jgi:hypothetical protein